MLGTLIDGAFEEHLSDKSNTIHQELQRHCGVANESEFHEVCGIFVLAAVSRRDVGDHVSNERAVTTFYSGVTVVTTPRCLLVWRNGNSRAQVHSTLG